MQFNFENQIFPTYCVSIYIYKYIRMLIQGAPNTCQTIKKKGNRNKLTTKRTSKDFLWCEESREGTIFHLLGSLGLLRFPQTRQKMLSFILFILRKIQYFSNKQQHPEAGERTSKDNILNLPTAARQPTGLAKGQCHKDKKSIFFLA